MIQRERRRLIIPFLAPALLIYAVFFIYPALQSLWVSLHDWSGFVPDMKWVGLGNFNELLHTPLYWQVLRQTLGLLLVGGILTFGLSLFFTGLLSSGLRGRKLFRAVLFLPNVVAMVALATLWGFVYNARFGLLNSILRGIGLERLGNTTWMGPDLIYWTMMIAVVWIYVGFYAVLLMAGADKIPQSLYDAARVEGANRLQMFLQVTVPLMWDVIAVAIVLWVVDALTQFEFYFTVGLTPPTSIWTISIYTYTAAFGRRTPIFRMGYATAIAVTLLIVVVIFVAGARRLLHREQIEY